MSDDNSHGFCTDIKMVEVASPIENCCRGSGEYLPPNTNSTWAPTTHCDTSPPLMESSDSFEPRPFPPPSLLDVPVEYIIDQLHNLAPHYWDKLETADCTLGLFQSRIPAASTLRNHLHPPHPHTIHPVLVGAQLSPH
ncbi:hypothetical protein EV421DRAFT_742810 [Armillaria borealis]|uniref:Uncharacterized protein n=1 Tax=Armillaria borealis TaxID=47425 RepID=A0AA39MP26_9AGAR|nr:hypothetical protein EV421DRAFT_742810 [Armillaria borealis]